MLLPHILLAFATVATAGKISSCKSKCFQEAIDSIGCASSDTRCICASDFFTQTLTRCVEESCSADESHLAKNALSQVCSKFQSELKRAPQGDHWNPGRAPMPGLDITATVVIPGLPTKTTSTTSKPTRATSSTTTKARWTPPVYTTPAYTKTVRQY